MIIEAERLFLREMNEDDYDALYSVLADSDIMQHYPYTFDENRVKNWIRKNKERYRTLGFELWAVCLKENGKMIGDCGLTLQNIEGELLPEIGYYIRADQQQKGYAKEAAAAVRVRNSHQFNGSGIFAAIALVMMMAGAMGMNIVPKDYFGIVERFSVFAVTGYNAVLGMGISGRTL